MVECGEQCVTTYGAEQMQLLPADNWDSLAQVATNIACMF